jgi:hypothetical protein
MDQIFNKESWRIIGVFSFLRKDSIPPCAELKKKRHVEKKQEIKIKSKLNSAKEYNDQQISDFVYLHLFDSVIILCVW